MVGKRVQFDETWAAIEAVLAFLEEILERLVCDQEGLA
jgi:hypothetical protein